MFSNTRCVLSQCNRRLLYLLNKTIHLSEGGAARGSPFSNRNSEKMFLFWMLSLVCQGLLNNLSIYQFQKIDIWLTHINLPGNFFQVILKLVISVLEKLFLSNGHWREFYCLSANTLVDQLNTQSKVIDRFSRRLPRFPKTFWFPSPSL